MRTCEEILIANDLLQSATETLPEIIISTNSDKFAKAMQEYADEQTTLLVFKLKQWIFDEISVSDYLEAKELEVVLEKINELYPIPD